MRALYLLLITVANILTAKFDPLVLAGGGLVVPIGSLFAGAVFVLRDLVQMKHGRAKTYTTILSAAALSGALSIGLGDTAHVAVASVMAFFGSEAVDTEIFSRMRRSMPARILLSGIVGGALDSVLFVLLGLSPMTSNMIPWEAVPSAVLGQMLVKIGVQLVALVTLLLRNALKKERKNE